MPWKESDLVNERLKFVTRKEAGESLAALCREFEISRKTGHKIWKRFKEEGPEGLYDRPSTPGIIRHRVTPEVRKLILDLKEDFPSWGAKKLWVRLKNDNPGVRIPARSTIGEILSKEGLVNSRRRRKPAVPWNQPLKEACAPNEIWTADYKGDFRLKNKSRCYPLTVNDHYSRYALGCEGLDSTDGYAAKVVFTRLFRQFGLPKLIRTDNGAPFASNGLLGLTRLSVFWIRLGIEVERIEPGHPEQNGRHERFHRTLKQETLRPIASNQLEQQERFDLFLNQYNNLRPHEALGMSFPSQLYVVSDTPYPEKLPEPEYPYDEAVAVVRRCGHVAVNGKSFYLSSALADQLVGFREIEDGKWLTSFMNLRLGVYDERERTFEVLTHETEEN